MAPNPKGNANTRTTSIRSARLAKKADDAKIIAEATAAILTAVAEAKTKQRPLAPPFERLPTRSQLPEYYQTIKDPIDIDTIRKKASRKEYPSVAALVEDFQRLFYNTQVFNSSRSLIYKDSRTLTNVVRRAAAAFVPEDELPQVVVFGGAAKPAPLPAPATPATRVPSATGPDATVSPTAAGGTASPTPAIDHVVVAALTELIPNINARVLVVDGNTGKPPLRASHNPCWRTLASYLNKHPSFRLAQEADQKIVDTIRADHGLDIKGAVDLLKAQLLPVSTAKTPPTQAPSATQPSKKVKNTPVRTPSLNQNKTAKSTKKTPKRAPATTPTVGSGSPLAAADAPTCPTSTPKEKLADLMAAADAYQASFPNNNSAAQETEAFNLTVRDLFARHVLSVRSTIRFRGVMGRLDAEGIFRLANGHPFPTPATMGLIMEDGGFASNRWEPVRLDQKTLAQLQASASRIAKAATLKAAKATAAARAHEDEAMDIDEQEDFLHLNLVDKWTSADQERYSHRLGLAVASDHECPLDLCFACGSNGHLIDQSRKGRKRSGEALKRASSSAPVTPVKSESGLDACPNAPLAGNGIPNASVEPLQATTEQSTTQPSKAQPEPSAHTAIEEQCQMAVSYSARLWQCKNCQTCDVCTRIEPTQHLLSCDVCGVHRHAACASAATPSYMLATQRWVCTDCVQCEHCGATDVRGHRPDPKLREEPTWQCDFRLCFDCGLNKLRGNFCPVCGKTYRGDDYDVKMVGCDRCDRWLHAECDDIDEARYHLLTFVPSSMSYFCPDCRRSDANASSVKELFEAAGSVMHERVGQALERATRSSSAWVLKVLPEGMTLDAENGKLPDFLPDGVSDFQSLYERVQSKGFASPQEFIRVFGDNDKRCRAITSFWGVLNTELGRSIDLSLDPLPERGQELSVLAAMAGTAKTISAAPLTTSPPASPRHSHQASDRTSPWPDSPVVTSTPTAARATQGLGPKDAPSSTPASPTTRENIDLQHQVKAASQRTIPIPSLQSPKLKDGQPSCPEQLQPASSSTSQTPLNSIPVPTLSGQFRSTLPIPSPPKPASETTLASDIPTAKPPSFLRRPSLSAIEEPLLDYVRFVNPALSVDMFRHVLALFHEYQTTCTPGHQGNATRVLQGFGLQPEHVQAGLEILARTWIHVNCLLWSPEVYEGPHGLCRARAATRRGRLIMYCDQHREYGCRQEKLQPSATALTPGKFRVERHIVVEHQSGSREGEGEQLEAVNRTLSLLPSPQQLALALLARFPPKRVVFPSELLQKLQATAQKSLRLPQICIGAFKLLWPGSMAEHCEGLYSDKLLLPNNYLACRRFWDINDVLNNRLNLTSYYMRVWACRRTDDPAPEDPDEAPMGAARCEAHDLQAARKLARSSLPRAGAESTDGDARHDRKVSSVSTEMNDKTLFRLSKQMLATTVRVSHSKIHGIGLFALRPLKPGEMIIEYAGEQIRPELTDKREAYYDSRGIGCYMFRVDANLVVDATLTGNPARFVNHSCDPNCASRIIQTDVGKHIVIFAERNIAVGEELTYDYKV
ncbi:uncharacterized protein MONBRDRAFT_27206 [Monosiga brevicollis MX1]|uniref:Histone-lysine N-methyltransferase n=1 Tax=Monosiga brevicollis TaxID=81824 RepID=A9V4L9_MONBE|nr:uncharacterized protein MONBRDRAFT_27206 [Monosiga brevicollis MX1]EDQ87394.1 predicted protein [Monosiga brevicollis MX1]|eukprot:XP_001747654.1 hypothetical protein [Monosiga brevicollis MX1]